MIAEAIEKIRSMAFAAFPAQQFEYDGRKFTDRALTEIKPPLAAAIGLETLTGLVDFIEEAKAAPGGASCYFLHIVNFARVDLVSVAVDEWKRRLVAATAECKEAVRFNFGNYLGQEAFIIGLLANFVPTDQRDNLIKFVSKIAAQNELKLSDDGLSQEVETKSGVVLKAEHSTTTPQRLLLQPYRTFREVNQPESEFILRVKADGNGVPTLALFEADGGKWKNDAVEIIRRWLASNQGESPLPIVA